MSDYVFKYTSTPTTNASFVVKPYTANGPASPSVSTLYNNSVSGIFAVTASTPLVLVGKGVIDYGQAVQNNLIYITENFCNKSRPQPPLKGMIWYKSENYTDTAHPTDPTTAGVYVWNGSSWNTITVNGMNATSLDANNQRVIRVADAINATDALNIQSADARYLPLTGGTVSGNVTITAGNTITLVEDPTTARHAVPKTYVDAANSVLQANIVAVHDQLQTDIGSIQTQLNNYLPLAGGGMTGALNTTSSIIMGAAGSLLLSPGAGVVQMGGRRVQQVADPILAADATTKSYVDNTIADAIAAIDTGSTPVADGVVTSGAFDSGTGTLTLGRSMALPDVTVVGKMAPFVHTHGGDDVVYDITTNKGQGVLNSTAAELGIGLTTASIASVLTMIDQVLYFSQVDPVRELQTGDGVDTTFTLDPLHGYEVWSERLQVFVNGIKQYADTRSVATVTVENATDGLGFNTLTGLAAATYPQTFTVDGVDYTINVPVAANATYWDVIVSMSGLLSTVPVGLLVEQLFTGIWLSFVSLNTGPTHSVVVTYAPGELFNSMINSSAPTSTVGALYSYSEDGTPGDLSTQITFHAAPAIGSVIEFTVQR